MCTCWVNNSKFLWETRQQFKLRCFTILFWANGITGWNNEKCKSPLGIIRLAYLANFMGYPGIQHFGCPSYCVIFLCLNYAYILSIFCIMFCQQKNKKQKNNRTFRIILLVHFTHSLNSATHFTVQNRTGRPALPNGLILAFSKPWPCKCAQQQYNGHTVTLFHCQ